MAVARETDALVRAAANVRWWPAAIGFILLGIAYALISERLTLGPPWAVLVLAVVAVVGARLLRGRGLINATRWLVLGVLAAVTAALTASAAFLVRALI